MRPDGRPKAPKIKGGSFAALIRAFKSPENPKWARYSEETRRCWGRELDLAERPEILGALSVHEIRPSHVQAFLDGLADFPGKQASAQAALRAVAKWALVRDLLAFPITMGTEVVGVQGGYTPWSDEQVELAELHARTMVARAVTLAANTGQRGSDLVRMRPTDVEVFRGRPGIRVTQQKTGRELWIPLTEPLQAALATWERRPGPFLYRADGRPFTRKKLSNLFWRECQINPVLQPLAEAGLVMHGLRATAAVRLRRHGATESQIADMLGMSIEMVQRYCRLSVQRENALAAVLHLDRTSPERRSGEGGKSGPVSC
jgi:integrase